MDVGRICLKTKGREAGKRCVIVDVIDRNYVMVTGPFELTGVKRRRINMNHLKPLDEAIEIPQNATDAEIIDVIG
jgi:large subunit ribosomal protein L14e